MMIYIFVFIFGGLGALFRFYSQQLSAGLSFPWAVFLLNVLGSFLIGALMSRGVASLGWDSRWVLALSAGFLGGMTTFSGFSIEAVRLWEAQAMGPFLGLVVGQNILALGFCFLGFKLFS